MRSSNSTLRWLTAAVLLTLAWPVIQAAPARAATITSLSPSSASAGGAAFTLTINGSNFTPASASKWGAAALKTTYRNATQLTAVVPASLIATAGTAEVTVSTAGSVSSLALFTVLPSSPAAGRANPAFGIADRYASAPSSASTINSAPTTTDSPVPASTSASDGADAPLQQQPAATGSDPVLAAAIGTAPATKANSTNSAASAPKTAVVSAAASLSTLAVSSPSPTVTSLNPTSVVVGAEAFTLTVNGANFLSGAQATVVRWNSTPLTTTYVSATQVTASVPASLLTGVGTESISVVTTNGTSSGVAFTINPAPPTIFSVSPKSLRAGSGDFTLTIVGSNLTSSAVINWGATPLATTAVGSGTLTAAVPASLVATVGSVSVTVTNAGGTSAPVTFTIQAPLPEITSLSPASVAAGCAQFTLTVNGTNFSSTAGVYWGSTWLATTYVSATQLTAKVPASLLVSAEQLGVRVYGAGFGWSMPVAYTINPAPPTITSLSPASVTANGAGFELTINGAAFTPGATSMWGTTSLDTVYVSPTQLAVSVPASLTASPGTAAITVTTAEGTSAPATITVTPPLPMLSGLNPSIVTAGGPAFTLTVSGENFTSASKVKWGSSSLTTTYVSATELTAAVPASLIATSGTAAITVGNSSGASAAIMITINLGLQITTTALPPGTAGMAYSAQINVTGGSPGYTWTVSGLPGELTYATTFDSTLTITGTPTSSGTITFQVAVTDSTGATAGPVTFTINVSAGPNGANNGNLNGTYVCLFQGFFDGDGTRWASVASFQADGEGNFTSGVFDTNSYDIGSASGTIAGTYSIGSDNNGLASLHTILTDGAAGVQTAQWAVSVSGAAQPARQFRMIEADDQGTLPSGERGTATCYQATTSAFAPSTLSGASFAFALNGEDNNGNLKAAVGLFRASGGAIANGNIDIAQGGSAAVQTDPFTGTYSTPDPSTGRFTIALSGAGNSTGFTVYIIDANHMFVLDNSNDDGEQAGNLRTQQQASYSGASIEGPFVLSLDGAEFNGGGNTPSGYYASVRQGSGDGAGNLTINQSYTDDDGVYSAASANGGPAALTFDSAHPGRATFQSAAGAGYLYLFNTSSGFVLDVNGNGSVDSGWLEQQTQTTFTSAALAGNYVMVELQPLSGAAANSVGQYDLSSSGTITGGLSAAAEGAMSWDQSISMTYSWDTTAPGTGAFLIANSAGTGSSCVIISATGFACTPQTDAAPSVEVFEE